MPPLWILLPIILALVMGNAYLAYLYGFLPGTYRYHLKSLSHKSRKIKIAAATKLGKYKNPEAVAPLIRMLKQPDPGIRKACVAALGNIGRPAIEPLCQTFIHHDEELRFAASEALYAIDQSQSIEPMCKKLATSPTFVRRYLSEVIVKIGENCIEPLLRHSPDISSSVDDRNLENANAIHELFVSTLMRIGKKKPDILYHAIAAGENQKLFLAEALGRLGDERAPGLLCSILGTKNPVRRSLALQGLKDMGEMAIPAILDVLKGKSELAKAGAVDLLVAIGGRANRALFELIEFDDPEVRLQAAIALGKMGRVRSLVTVMWPKNHIEVAYIIENGSKTKIESLGNLPTIRKAIEQAIFFGKVSKKYRSLYYLQSLTIVLYPDTVSRIDDPRMGRILSYDGSVLENLGFLKYTHIHPYARKVLEKPKKVYSSNSGSKKDVKAPKEEEAETY